MLLQEGNGEKERETEIRAFGRSESSYRARPFSESYASRAISVNKLGDDDAAGGITLRHLE